MVFLKEKNYSARQQPTDCWNARLLECATYTDKWEFPIFPCTNAIPSDLHSFRYIDSTTSNSSWIHFYGFDEYLEDVWENPKIWATQLKRFAGAISPDLSVYRDMPLAQQIYNAYRNRVLAHWFTQQGIPVIPNIRCADQRSFDFVFEGIDRNGTVCVSTSGVLLDKKDRTAFIRGLDAMLEALTPQTVLVYGSMPFDIFGKHLGGDTRFVQYDIDTQKAHRRGDC